MFIELTGIKGKKFLVNLNFIESIVPGSVVTYIYISELGDSMKVKESYDQVKELIKREVAAERGY